MIATPHYLWLSGALFVLGVAGIATKRDVVSALISIQLIFLAAVINLAAFPRARGAADGAAFAIFVLMASAVDAAIGLAIAGPGGKRSRSLSRPEARSDSFEPDTYQAAAKDPSVPASEDAEIPAARP